MAIIKPARPKVTRRSDQRETTRRKLLESARSLFAERGFDGTTVTDIAHAAGVSHTLINAYFNGKPGLLYQILSENNARQNDHSGEILRAEGDVACRLGRLMTLWIRDDLADPSLFAVMQAYSWQWPSETERENRIQLERVFAPITAILNRGILDGELRQDIDIEAVTEVILAIYRAGLRPAVFQNCAAEDCLERIMYRLDFALTGVRLPAPAPD